MGPCGCAHVCECASETSCARYVTVCVCEPVCEHVCEFVCGESF